MSENAGWSAVDLRRRLEEEYVDGVDGAVSEAVLADRRRLVDLMVRLVTDYPSDDPRVPDDVTDSVMYKRLKSRMESHRGYDAVRHGDLSTLRFMAPPDSDGKDATGNELIRNALAREGAHIHFFGPKNSGKTNKAHYYAVDVCSDVFDTVRSNLTALDGGDPYAEDEERIEGQHDSMRGFVEELHTEDKYVCRIMDEVSSAMNGYAFSQSKVEMQMSQSINATRKYTEGGATNLITVSHRESLGDVHPLVIENADLVIQCYDGEYGKATVYKGHFDKSKVDLEDQKITDLYGIPPTTVEHSDSIMAKWYWNAGGYDYREGLSSLEDDEDDSEGTASEDTVDPEEVALRAREDEYLRMHENGKSYSQIAESTGTPQSTVGDMVRRARDRQQAADDVE